MVSRGLGLWALPLRPWVGQVLAPLMEEEAPMVGDLGRAFPPGPLPRMKAGRSTEDGNGGWAQEGVAYMAPVAHVVHVARVAQVWL